MLRTACAVFALGLILALPGWLASVDAAPDAAPIIYRVGEEPQPEPSPVRWDNHIATLGAVRLDAATKTVIATGWVNQTDGAVEVLACGPKGKVHESVFVLALNPLDLQAALLLAGLKGGEPMPDIGVGPPNGSPLDIYVDWRQDGEARTARAETFLWNVQEDAVVPETPWTFTGSFVRDGQFKALVEESLVVTFWDPFAIIDLPLPCGADDEIIHVNSNAVPPVQTPITMRFVPR